MQMISGDFWTNWLQLRGVRVSVCKGYFKLFSWSRTFQYHFSRPVLFVLVAAMLVGTENSLAELTDLSESELGNAQLMSSGRVQQMMDSLDKEEPGLKELVFALKLLKVGEKELAEKWLLASAEKGSGFAFYVMAKIRLSKGGDNAEADWRNWMNKAIERGVQIAIYERADQLYSGAGRDQDFNESFRLACRSAKAGYPPSEFLLSKQLYYGVGVESSLRKAIYWAGKAKRDGYVRADEYLRSWQKEFEQKRLVEDGEILCP